jgi:hypothetical protein
MTSLFLFCSYAAIIIIFFFMPKRLTVQEAYITWTTVALLTLISDLVLGDLLDQYDLMNRSGPEWSDLLVEISLPAAFGILYMNFMPRGRKKFVFYFVFWVLFSVGYEQISRYFGYVHYKDWKVWYSFIFYFFACLFMRWQYWFIKQALINKRGD